MTSNNNNGNYDGEIPTESTSSEMAAPIFITVGPPCSGKTTWLKKRKQSILDISIDDQPGVYVPIGTNRFLEIASMEKGCDALDGSRQILGKTVHERIQQQKELVAVLRRLSGNVSESQFRAQIEHELRGKALEESNSCVNMLCEVVESFCKKGGVKLNDTTDLFVFESLFQHGAGNSLPAIKAAEQKLANRPRHQAIAWGNTNTRVTDYVGALQLARRQNRPVHFVPYQRTEPQETERANLRKNDTISDDVPTLGGNISQLVHRSIQRLLDTGRHVPVSVLYQMHERSTSLLRQALGQWKVHHDNQAMNPIDQLALDRSFTQLAGLDLDKFHKVFSPPTRKHSRPGIRHHPYRCQNGQKSHHPYRHRANIVREGADSTRGRGRGHEKGPRAGRSGRGRTPMGSQQRK